MTARETFFSVSKRSICLPLSLALTRAFEILSHRRNFLSPLSDLQQID